jgi:hypothetical protein
MPHKMNILLKRVDFFMLPQVLFHLFEREGDNRDRASAGEQPLRHFKHLLLSQAQEDHRLGVDFDLIVGEG